MAGAITINKAGKVRNQTPKDPVKDKERKVCGRSRQRLRFEKRSEIGYFDANGKMKLNAQS
ncbi:ribosomal protein S30 [Ordospora colligata]|uniref:40S ribosomal protein S30 n=1 Tax=Ordospora colligata OC4 TaxID=1354746 RepID=A0A0B2UFE2_9MICR|nr:ribosomal protein S30 [Ordospora colligata OC4]KHN69751.1 ribosomal protein S30 [Ordospora colligata OC4]TBU15554.1 ribosomal protein S30 [Ordospora colligata]TBU15621.1 ribosomal protein S30 [Ordospora colligata]TBU18672.1 ribosomal protein S30 [Ordospora colligata]